MFQKHVKTQRLVVIRGGAGCRRFLEIGTYLLIGIGFIQCWARVLLFSG